MDAGQLSRSLRMLEAHGCVSLAREAPDARYLQVHLTPEGVRTLGAIDRRMRDVAMRMMRRFSEEERAALVAAMGALSGILRHRRLWPPEKHVLVPFQVPRLRRAD
jgi:DNA-binding MarR family transcriptional regulator